MSRKGFCYVIMEGVLLLAHLILMKQIFNENKTLASMALVGTCVSAAMLLGSVMLALLELRGFFPCAPKESVSRLRYIATFALWALCFVAGEIGDSLSFSWNAPVPQKTVLSQGAMALMLIIGSSLVLRQQIRLPQLVGLGLGLLGTVGITLFSYATFDEASEGAGWALIVLITCGFLAGKHLCGRRAMLLAGHARMMANGSAIALVLFVALGVVVWDRSALNTELWIKTLCLSSVAPFISLTRQLAFQEEVHPAIHDTLRCTILLLPPLLLGSWLFADSPDLALWQTAVCVGLLAASSWLLAKRGS